MSWNKIGDGRARSGVTCGRDIAQTGKKTALSGREVFDRKSRFGALDRKLKVDEESNLKIAVSALPSLICVASHWA